jgi:hypothetical protein
MNWQPDRGPAKDGSASTGRVVAADKKPVKRRIGKAHVVPRAQPITGDGLASWQKTYLVPRGAVPAGC